MRVDVILTAQLPIPRAYAFRPQGAGRLAGVLSALRPGSDVLPSQCLAFAVHHPTAGPILIDTGMHPDARTALRRDFGAAMGTFFRGMRPAEEPFDAQLRELGIDPDGVERVVMTHLHADHTSAMRLLPAAEFTCSRAEWAATRGRGAAAKGYVRHHLPDESRMRLLDLERDGEPHGPFSRTVDLLGDGSVRLVSTPGHTAGHLSVLLKLAGGQQLLVAGDAAYTLDNVRDVHLPLLTADDEASRRSLRELRAFLDDTPGAIVVPTHDPEAWRELRRLLASCAA